MKRVNLGRPAALLSLTALLFWTWCFRWDSLPPRTQLVRRTTHGMRVLPAGPAPPSPAAASTAPAVEQVSPGSLTWPTTTTSEIAGESPAEAIHRAQRSCRSGLASGPASGPASDLVRGGNGANHSAYSDGVQRRRSQVMDRYVALHRHLLEGSEGSAFTLGGSLQGSPGDGQDAIMQDAFIPRRFIHVTPCCQLCNRVRVLVSALALGILTDRAVLIDFDHGYYGVFADLFDSPLRLQAPLPHGLGDGSRTLSWLHTMKGLMCDTPLAWDETVVTIQGSPAFLHSLYLNPSLRSAFDSKFGSLDGLFAEIVWRLLVPTPSLLQSAAAFMRTLRTLRGRRGDGQLPNLGPGGGVTQSGAAYVVGLHIRNGRDFRSKKLTGQEWRRLAKCAAALVPAGRRAVYLVATESEASQKQASIALPGAIFYQSSLPRGKGSRKGSLGKEGNGSVTREGARRSLLELLLLSYADANLLTPMSSFSEMAAALAQRPALYFHFDLRRKFHYESATEIRPPGCFVPFTAEMPGSMNLRSIVRALPCSAAVLDHSAGGRSAWSDPTGMRFLTGDPKLPEELAKSVTEY